MEQDNRGTTTGSCTRCGAPVDAETRGLCPACLARGVIATETGAGRGPDLPSAGDLDSRLEGIEVHELIGRGGMGAVFRGRQVSLDRPVAIKLLLTPDSTDPEFKERFRLEAQTLARLQHPNIVSVYDHGETDGYFYIVMEFVDGADLAHLIEEGTLGADQSLDLVLQICSALDYAHGMGVVHRDIKPANVLVDGAGHARIADFGFAKILGEEEEIVLTGVHQRLGTPFYMAPEQRSVGTAIDHRADLFSLGVVFYEMLTGEVPGGRFAPPSRMARHRIPSGVDAVVMKSLEADPERRYQSATEFARALASARKGRRSGALVAGLAGGLVLVTGVVLGVGKLMNDESSAPVDTPRERSAGPRPVEAEVIRGSGVLLDDRFDDDTIVTNERAGWTIQQVGKALALEPGPEGGVRWTTGGSPYGFAALRCNNAFVIPENGHLTITWEISELKADLVGDWSYAVDLALVPISVDPTDPEIFAQLHDAGFPTIVMHLQVIRSYEGVAFTMRYKDGSGRGQHAARERGEFLTHNPPFSTWWQSGRQRYELWLQVGHETIEAGWSGGPEVARTTWEETTFDPPSPRVFGEAVWPLLHAKNSESDVSGSHLLHRVKVEASAP